MAQINAYLMFSGNCKEAMEFYKSVFGGQLDVMLVEDFPQGETGTEAEKKKVMHSALFTDDFCIMASDMMGDESANHGNSVSLCVTHKTEEEINEAFAKLSKDAKHAEPLRKEFWGDIFGQITDKYGYQWMLTCKVPQA